MNQGISYAGKPRTSLWAGCLLLVLLQLSMLARAQEPSSNMYGKADDPLAAEALGIQIRTGNPEEMAYVIRQILLQNYAREQGLEATDEEIAQLLGKKQEVMQQDRKKMDERRAELEKTLKSTNPGDAERKQLEAELKALDAMQQAMADADSRAGTPEFAAAEAQVARGFVEQWKVNRGLYRQYGGRVTYQQSGAVPLDAHYAYLKAAQKSGQLKIVNKDFESALWGYYTTDTRHQFIPESGNQKEQAINTPWWMMEQNKGH